MKAILPWKLFWQSQHFVNNFNNGAYRIGEWIAKTFEKNEKWLS